LLNGEPLSYRCLSTLVHPGVAGFVTLDPHQIFIVGEFTVPACRRRGITRLMAIAMTPRLIAHGFREVLGVHRTDNHDTITAVARKGIPTLGTVTRTRTLWKISSGGSHAFRGLGFGSRSTATRTSLPPTSRCSPRRAIDRSPVGRFGERRRDVTSWSASPDQHTSAEGSGDALSVTVIAVRKATGGRSFS
jgi:hypothetical protein